MLLEINRLFQEIVVSNIGDIEQDLQIELHIQQQ